MSENFVIMKLHCQISNFLVKYLCMWQRFFLSTRLWIKHSMGTHTNTKCTTSSTALCKDQLHQVLI